MYLEDSAKLYSERKRIYSDCVVCHFTFIIGLVIQLLKTRIHCCKANDSKDITLHVVINYIQLYFVTYSLYRQKKYFQRYLYTHTYNMHFYLQNKVIFESQLAQELH